MRGGEEATLSEFCRIVQGGRHRRSGNDFVRSGYPAWGAGGLNGHLDFAEFEEPAVILSAIGARCGKCFFVDGKWTSLANTQIILPDPSRADPKFLWYQLNDENRWPRSGTGQPFIKPSDVKAHRVRLPPLPEQRRIADILDRAEALRAKRREALAKLEELVGATFRDLFGDPVANDRGWSTRAFDETMTDETSRSGKLQKSEFLPVGRFPVIDQGQSEIAGYTDDSELLCSSSLPAIVFGDHTRIVKLVRHPFVIGADGAKVLLPRSGIEAVYLSELLRRLPIPDLGYSRHMREVKRMTFPIPPLPLQQRFAHRIEAIDRLKAAHRRSLAELDALFASLQHRAFRGEL